MRNIIRIIENNLITSICCIIRNVIDYNVFITCVYKYYTFTYKISIIDSSYRNLNYVDFKNLID